MSRSASKIRDVRSSSQKELSSLKSRRSVSVDTRARGSYVPEKRRPSSEERKSGNKLIRWSNTRKSSINLADSKRKEMRKLADKAYQKKKVSEIVEFINETGFSPPMTVQKLKEHSKKDVESVFQFLYRFFDVTYEVKKFDEEGPKILKNLLYPFTIPKSSFVYVAPNQWPPLLGALIWLMDLSKFAMKVDLNNLSETAGDDENAEIHKILLQYICQCYHARTDNEEEEIAVYTQIVKSKVDLDKVKAENEEKKQLVTSIEKDINERKGLFDHIVEQDKNIEKYKDYILKMESHYKNRSETYEKLMNELKLKESQLKILQEQVSQKQDLYDAQGFDGKKHLNFFEMQKREITEKLEKKRTIVKEMQTKNWEAEIEYTKISEKVIAAAENSRTLYNSAIESLKNAVVPLLNIKDPKVQKFNDNFQVNFRHSDIPPDESSVQSKIAFRDSWKNLAMRIKDTDEILKRTCDSLNQKFDEVETKNSQMSMSLKVLRIENSKLEQDLNSKKKTTDDGISTFEAQCEHFHEKFQILQSEKLQLEKKCSEMIEEKNTLQEFLKKKKKQLEEYLVEQKDLFDYFLRSEEQAWLECEVYGNEIVREFEKLDCL